VNLSFWSILLIAAASQSLFLIVTLIIRPLRNKQANLFLLFLLIIILITNVSNTWTAVYLYRKFPFPAAATRGMVLLLGPIIYLYTLSSIEPLFIFKKKYWLHFIPYITVLLINMLRLQRLSSIELVADMDEFMAGRSTIDLFSGLLFFMYSIHILIYLLIIYGKIRKTLQQSREQYIVPLQQRINWLKNINRSLGLTAIVFLGISVYILFTRTYTIEGNIIYTITLALLVYLISYQAIQGDHILTPGFEKKYRSQKVDDATKDKIISTVLHLLEYEKVFMDPDLTLSMLAERAGTQPYISSQLINEQLNKTFTELLNQYRIEEFKKRIVDPEYKKYSITGLANEIGYNSKSAFNSAFKKITSQTPSEYIKSIK